MVGRCSPGDAVHPPPPLVRRNTRVRLQLGGSFEPRRGGPVDENERCANERSARSVEMCGPRTASLLDHRLPRIPRTGAHGCSIARARPLASTRAWFRLRHRPRVSPRVPRRGKRDLPAGSDGRIGRWDRRGRAGGAPRTEAKAIVETVPMRAPVGRRRVALAWNAPRSTASNLRLATIDVDVGLGRRSVDPPSARWSWLDPDSVGAEDRLEACRPTRRRRPPPVRSRGRAPHP